MMKMERRKTPEAGTSSQEVESESSISNESDIYSDSEISDPCSSDSEDDARQEPPSASRAFDLTQLAPAARASTKRTSKITAYQVKSGDGRKELLLERL